MSLSEKEIFIYIYLIPSTKKKNYLHQYQNAPTFQLLLLNRLVYIYTYINKANTCLRSLSRNRFNQRPKQSLLYTVFSLVGSESRSNIGTFQWWIGTFRCPGDFCSVSTLATVYRSRDDDRLAFGQRIILLKT